MIKCSRLQHRPDSVCSWFVSICASVCQALNLGLCVSFGVLLPELMKQFNEGRAKTVWVGSLALALTFFLGPLGSLLCETIGCRFTAIIGCLTCGVSLVITSYSSSLQWIFVSYGCLFGLGSSLMFSSHLLITAKNFRRWQSLAVGVVSVGGSIGVLILGPTLQLLIDTVGWRGTYRIISAPFFAMACVCGALFGDPIQDTPKTTPQNCTENPGDLKILSVEELCKMDTRIVNLGYVEDDSDRNKERKEDSTECDYQKEIKTSKTGKLWTFLDFSVFKVPSYTIAMLSLTVMYFGHYIPQIHLIKYCLDIGISADSASLLYIYLGLSSCVARVATGRLCDVKRINTIIVYQIGDLLVGFVTIVLPIIQTYRGLVVFVVFYGFGDGIFITTMNSLLMFTVDEKRRAAALGLGNCLLSFGLVAGAPMAGYLADVFNCYTWPFFMAGILTHIAGLLPLFLSCLQKKKSFDLKKNVTRKP